MPAEAERSDPSLANVEMPAIPDRERRMLEFERRWWKHAGAKEEAIRAEFDLPPARYYQVLNATLDLPAALFFDPLLVRRLQRLRDARTGARSSRVLGSPDSTHQ